MDASSDDEEFSFHLIPSPEERGQQTHESVGKLIKALTDAGVHHVPPRMAFDAVDGGGISVHEFMMLVSDLTGPAKDIIVAWLAFKAGRGCQVGKDTIKAPTAAETETLMRVEAELHEAAKKNKRKRKKKG